VRARPADRPLDPLAEARRDAVVRELEDARPDQPEQAPGGQLLLEPPEVGVSQQPLRATSQRLAPVTRASQQIDELELAGSF
jgi:hypothetical protein